MSKIHTRMKLSHGLSTHLNPYKFFHSGIKNSRPKTFKTEGDAHKWAAEQGLNQDEYSLKKVKKNKKYQVVVENGEKKNTI